MNENSAALKKGDSIRVKFPTHDGYIRHSATVEHVDCDKIVAVFASGFKYPFRNDPDRYERVTGAANG